MSKHTSADNKLHIQRSARNPGAQPTKPADPSKTAPQVPPKGTNANNQYR
ncbi:MAG TPA: hypothetical protein VFP35_02435 [Candidatus Saccharimonadales bacterium]|nr:hypothetical protein [Candidatus Saccharimonadales bacterium]